MQCTPITHSGYQLFQQGSITLAEMECNGIRIDTDYINRAQKQLNVKIQKLTVRMQKDEVYRIWKRKYGVKMNFGSREQLGDVVFNELEGTHGTRTKTGRYKADKAALENIDLLFLRRYTKLEQFKKASSTYLKGIQRHVDSEGFIHPFFALDTVRTFRSSSTDPNLHNIPVREPFIKKLIRRGFIPREPNRHIVEHDFSGIEVKTAACYNHDPTLLRYIRDKKSDMHRDMCMQIYHLTINEYTDALRHCAKNKFVFPEFYGDWYINCAKSLWNVVHQLHLKTKTGEDVYKHLRRHGITKLGRCTPGETPLPHSFEGHVKRVEKDFWENRFRVYTEWKWDWWEDYLDRGFFDTLTGFRIAGAMDRKKVINYPIQGSAFHCLLWCITRINKLLRKYKMKTKLIGQIHDSVIGDVLHRELKDYIEIAHQVMTIDLRKHWSWIIVPMDVDAEVSPMGRSWFEKEKYKP